MNDNTQRRSEVGKTVEFVNGPHRRRRNPFSWRGYLTPDFDENSKDLTSSFGVHEIKSTGFTIGRHPKSNLVLTSQDVSREHARIHRIESDFYVEDLNSRHGTYVNGDRVLWCRLSDGDVLQFGARSRRGNIWFFDRAAIRKEVDEPGSEEQAPRSRPEFLPQDQLSVTFWGCRGSIATPGSHTDAYGGNTTCVEVRFGNMLFVLDAGTGIRALSKAWTREFGDSPLVIHLMFSHLHWDHIQGFPFLSQAYNPDHELHVYGLDSVDGTVRETLSNQMQGRYFPIPMEAMSANFDFRQLSDAVDLGPVHLSSLSLPHPGGSLAYKFATPSGTFIFATDCELHSIVDNRDQVRFDDSKGRRFPEELIRFFQGADLLVIDCQYTDEQYRERVGWGHNSESVIVDFCQQTEVRTVAITHHDPSSSDADIRRLVETIDAKLQISMQEMAPDVIAAREEMTVVVRGARYES